MKNNVKELRIALNLRQEDLANMLAVSRQTIISVELGRYSPSLELAMRIARIFNKPVEEIFMLD
ncbi:MAG: helix-turn-helix transcriptional regulator [Christensenellaceae bacterium]|nr:helix-turn-helix transcriptional regulator [Christensenellaceae bacterium]